MRALSKLQQYGFLSFLVLSSGSFAPSVQAQITPDGSLSTSVTAVGNNFTITGGDRANSNLFHSFDRFDIPPGGSATFQNPSLDLQNIFARVTGGGASTIDGLIQVQDLDATANLFLLNPNGIQFGSGAQLSLGGSFFATTAESLLFPEGDRYSFRATTPEVPLLSTNMPQGFQFGSNPGSIQVQGPGHTLGGGPFFGPVSSLFNGEFSSPIGPTSRLEVSSGQTLALVGGTLSLNGGALYAPGGPIELGAVGSGGVNSIVTLNPTNTGIHLDFSGMTTSGPVNFNQQALVNVSGISTAAGSIQVYGATVNFRDGSILLSQNLSDQPAGRVTIEATQSLQAEDVTKVPGTGSGEFLNSGVYTETLGLGKSADILIASGALTLLNGGQFLTRTFSDGASGDVQITASQSIEARRFSAVDPLALNQAGTLTFSSGQGGNLRVSTGQLILEDGTGFVAGSLGTGSSGNVLINADSIAILGSRPEIFARSSITAVSIALGNAGNITINTGSLIARDGGAVNAGNINGDAGDVVINASEFIDFSGFIPGIADQEIDRVTSGVDATIAVPSEELQALFRLSPFAQGNAGSVHLNTPVLRVTNRAVVSVQNFGVGNAGNLEIQANSIVLDDGGRIVASTTDGEGGGISIQPRDFSDLAVDIRNRGFISSGANGRGNGGPISINLATLNLAGGGEITSAAAGSGNAGSITISATDAITVQGTSSEGVSSRISAGVNATGTGQGGNLTLSTPRLTVQDGGEITASTNGRGKAGDLTIQAGEHVTVIGGTNQPTSRIAAQSTTDAPAGSVEIETPLLEIGEGGAVTVSSAGTGGAGNIAITGNRIRLVNGANINASTLRGTGGNINLLLQDFLSVRNGSLISAEAGGNFGGNINVVAGNQIFLDSSSRISASALETANGGNITLNTPFLTGLNNSDIIARAEQGQGGNIDITATGIFGLEFRDQLTPFSDINASSDFGVSGTVTITNPVLDAAAGLTDLPTTLSDASQQITGSCRATAEGNQFIITGRGGIPFDPQISLVPLPPWHDLRDLRDLRDSDDRPLITQASPNSGLIQATTPPTLPEATTWQRSANGTLELVAQVPRGPIPPHPATCAKGRVTPPTA